MENIKKTKKDYYKSFREKNLDKIHEKKTCEFCGGSYDYFNKSQHNKSLKCIKAKYGIDAYNEYKINRILKKSDDLKRQENNICNNI
jgi:hypothetical protein